MGNLIYRRTERNFNPLMAKAATITIAEVDEIVDVGELAPEGREDPHLVNAGGQFVTLLPYASICDQAEAFAMIRGGHIDISVLGALEVSEEGDLANWFVPERRVGRIGGAMDLVAGAKKVIIIMYHATRDGRANIVKKCSYPLTGKKVVDTIVTDLAFFEITEEGLLLNEIAPGFTVEEIQSLTEPQFKVSQDLKEMEVEPSF